VTRALSRKVALVESTLAPLADVQSRLDAAVALEGQVPGGDDNELRGIVVQLRAIRAALEGMVNAGTIWRDGRNSSAKP
jgi:hypothetical protein